MPRLSVKLPYGAGLKLQECVELPVTDIDFDRRERWPAREGQKTRRVMLPEQSTSASAASRGRSRYASGDLTKGLGRVVFRLRSGAKVAQRRQQLPMAVRVPGRKGLSRSRFAPRSRYHLHEFGTQTPWPMPSAGFVLQAAGLERLAAVLDQFLLSFRCEARMECFHCRTFRDLHRRDTVVTSGHPTTRSAMMTAATVGCEHTVAVDSSSR